MGRKKTPQSGLFVALELKRDIVSLNPRHWNPPRSSCNKLVRKVRFISMFNLPLYKQASPASQLSGAKCRQEKIASSEEVRHFLLHPYPVHLPPRHGVLFL
jgi:hypothetical protein